MRRRNSLPLLVAGAAVLVILAFVVVELGPPAAGPTGSAGASGAGVAASDETSSPGNGPTAAFSALASAIANASSGATWSATATQSGGSPSRPVATPVRTAVATPVHRGRDAGRHCGRDAHPGQLVPVSDLPGLERVEQGHLEAAGRRQFGGHDQRYRRIQAPSSGLRRHR